jgi:hypothetical protein
MPNINLAWTIGIVVFKQDAMIVDCGFLDVE